MQKKLLKDTLTEIAKGVNAYYGRGYVQVFIDDVEEDFNNKSIKIEIFRKQLQHWFFDAAETLIENEDNDFILMMICATYIEAIQQYKIGNSSNNRSGITFSNSLKEIFRIDSDTTLKSIYSALRCGLFHNSMVNENIRLVRIGGEAISDNNSVISINCIEFYKCIKEDFDNYITNLNNANKNDEIYVNFENMFKFEVENKSI